MKKVEKKSCRPVETYIAICITRSRYLSQLFSPSHSQNSSSSFSSGVLGRQDFSPTGCHRSPDRGAGVRTPQVNSLSSSSSSQREVSLSGCVKSEEGRKDSFGGIFVDEEARLLREKDKKRQKDVKERKRVKRGETDKEEEEAGAIEGSPGGEILKEEEEEYEVLLRRRPSTGLLARELEIPSFLWTSSLSGAEASHSCSKSKRERSLFSLSCSKSSSQRSPQVSQINKEKEEEPRSYSTYSSRKEENEEEEEEDPKKEDGERTCDLLSSMDEGLNASALQQNEGLKGEQRKGTPSLRSPLSVHQNKRTRKGNQKKDHEATTSSSCKKGKRERSPGLSSSSSPSCPSEKGFASDLIMVR